MVRKVRSMSLGKKRWLVPAVLVSILVVGTLVVLESTGRINLRSDTQTAGSTEGRNAKTTSTNDTAQADFSSGESRQTKPVGDVNQGGAVDNSSPIVAPPTSQQTTSPSGVITLFQPTKGLKISNGSVISGKSSVNPVYFRLVDNSVGVIAQGPLTVTNGSFSGTLQIEPKGTGGTLELFTTDSATGRESNHLQINVAF